MDLTTRRSFAPWSTSAVADVSVMMVLTMENE